ncbi:Catechol 2,3-dioxygenase [Lentzea fradiae]|uniref:Catechol 2,3-dioxygenase n=1 Tax=Lentzea fradiae TaxID=200378 RepID=A0A1G8BI88_9PSEU|nr:VOC family protein [Lentzea fradiae]SDH32878.1 Catechol 2,3-dioxygenase [Lentzea fradiae]
MTETTASPNQVSTLLPPAPRMHHIGIQTSDLANCVAWYRDFFGCAEKWSLEEFSDLTESRLPGMKRLTEVKVGDLRFHLFERADDIEGLPGGDKVQFQHVCLVVSSPQDLVAWRERWLELHASGRYRFASDEMPTDVVTDADGVQSCYLVDVNGLEFELTYVPGGDR